MTIRHYLNTAEIAQLRTKSNWRAAWEVAHTWLWIVFAFVLAAIYPHPLTILVSLLILGGKQLACAIILHDTSHHALFTSKKWNERIGNWLGGYPLLNDTLRYRPYHLRHHIHTGTPNDPDLSLTKGYPTSSKSMKRKFFRDLSGQTGVKSYVGLVMMHLGYVEYNLGGLAKRLHPKDRTWKAFWAMAWKNLAGGIIFQLLFLGVLWAFGHAWLYLLWIGAQLTTYQFCLRVRSMAEHSVLPDSDLVEENTRTVKANWLERMLFAPHHVNYHLEHHLLMTVPSYNYPKMHQLLQKRGFYEKENAPLATGYWEVIKLAANEK